MRKATCLILLVSLLACGCSKTKSTDQLIADLKSGEEKQRLIAARLLAQRQAEPAKVVPALTAALADHDGDVRWSAAIGLGYFGEQARDAIPALQKAAKDPDSRVREGAGMALSRIDPAKFSYSAKPKSQKKG